MPDVTACGDAAPVSTLDPESACDRRLVQLRSLRAPTVEEIEERLWLEEHHGWRVGGGAERREVRELGPLRDEFWQPVI